MPRVPPPRLDVYLDGQLVGDLERPGGGRIRFTYTEQTCEAYLNATLLSASLPVRRSPFPNAEAKPFFEGLLPEGALRDRVARELQVSPDDVHGLLARIGAECAGAVVIVPRGETPIDPERAQIEWHTEAELAERIGALRDHPLGITPGRVRLSLGGVQDKLVLVRNAAGRFGSPLFGAPSTHILKPELGRFQSIATNEAFCMKVAACLGLSVARAEVTTIGRYDCLVVERFDRTIGDGARIRRVHQEDFCQALGVLPVDKYEDAGGPSVASIVDATRRLSTNAAADVVTFIRSVIFNFLIGNSDAHGKNHALLFDPVTQARLAPFYDLVCTAVYDVEPRLAMSIGGQDDPEAIALDDWRRLSEEAGIGRQQLINELQELSARVVRCANQIREASHAEGWFQPVVDEIVAVTERRASAVRAGIE